MYQPTLRYNMMNYLSFQQMTKGKRQGEKSGTAVKPYRQQISFVRRSITCASLLCLRRRRAGLYGGHGGVAWRGGFLAPRWATARPRAASRHILHYRTLDPAKAVATVAVGGRRGTLTRDRYAQARGSNKGGMLIGKVSLCTRRIRNTLLTPGKASVRPCWERCDVVRAHKRHSKQGSQAQNKRAATE